MAQHTLKNIPAARPAALQARWVMEALGSGPAQTFKTNDLKAVFAAGLKRAATRKTASKSDLS